jgi:hypothetical protein
MNTAQSQKDMVRYSIAIALLMAITLMSPSMRAALADTSSSQSAAVLTASVVRTTDATARVIGNPKLVLTYDSNKKEAQLAATFTVSVDGGTNGVYVSSYVPISFVDSKGTNYWANSQKDAPLDPITKLDKQTDQYGQVYYKVPAHRQANFFASATVDPKQLFAGTYHASIPLLIGYNSLTDFNGSKYIPVDANTTNSVTIVGEVSPYITTISPGQVKAGDQMTISGQRLSASSLLIDGVETNVTVSTASNASQFIFTVPALTAGGHTLSLKNVNGMSNSFWFQVLAPVSAVSVTASLDASSPGAQTIQISKTAVTQNVPLAIFDLKASATSSLTGFSVNMNAISPSAKGGGSIGQLFSNIFMRINGQVYAETSLVGNTVGFAIPSIGLPTNTYVQITILGSVAADTDGSLNGSTAGVSLPLSGITAVDYLGNKIAVDQGNVVGTLAGSSMTFIDSTSGSYSSLSTTMGTVVTNQNGPSTQSFTMSYGLTAGNNPIYVSKTYANAVTVKISGNIGTSTNVSLMDNDSSNDGAAYFYIAPGQTKYFTAYNRVSGMPGTVAGTYSIVGLNYGTDSANPSALSLTAPAIASALTANLSF